jgi:hypothetical protein
MPPLDWIHVAMFAAGLILQYVGQRAGIITVTPSPAPTPPSAEPAVDTKPLLDLIHKLLDQRLPSSPK